jgi:hypothetical protein
VIERLIRCSSRCTQGGRVLGSAARGGVFVCV